MDAKRLAIVAGLVIAAGVIVAALATIVSEKATPADGSSPLDKAIERLSHARSPKELTDAYSSLLPNMPAQELNDLVASSDSGVALAAGWERVRRMVAAASQPAVVRPAADALSRFIGLVEGRSQVPLPDDWVTGLCSAYFVGASTAHFQRPAFEVPRAEVRREGDQWIVMASGKRWLSVGQPADDADICISRGTVFLALYSWPPSSYSIYALDEKSGSVRWESFVWVNGDVFAGGQGWHQAKLRLQGDSLLVFGVSDGAAYIEAFDARTGRNLWRFNTAYLDTRHFGEREGNETQ